MSGVIDELSGALAAVRTAVSSVLDLLSLEARRAGLALLWIVILGLVAAICIVTSWLALMAAIAMWAVAAGFPLLGSVIVVALINCLGGVLLIRTCFGISRDLLFSATRRQFAGAFPIKPSKP